MSGKNLQSEYGYFKKNCSKCGEFGRFFPTKFFVEVVGFLFWLPSGKSMIPAPPQEKTLLTNENVTTKLCSTCQMLGSKWGFIYNLIIIGFPWMVH
jgi:hypothetical protein